ncbi:MAG: hypothetical protein KZQ59_05115 [Candidatus Thiodiazotropha sp. (ex Lucinoma aequizonata)]|nr:hypothetical protein [Candidatus Thiodiazotropha sp. (ex Lucinoma aequizonata)]MCU7910639.1 hypothetical protein [Candidatus Thiodiazotropha sp. (ex Lucinoma aequizonata)]
MPSAALLSRFATTDTRPGPYTYRGLSYPPRAPLFHSGQREIKNSLGAGKTQCITISSEHAGGLIGLTGTEPGQEAVYSNP